MYDYSEVIYAGSLGSLSIICNKHGRFQQKASDHLSGYGCPSCGKERVSLGVEAFIKRANIRHDSKYNYANVNYVNSYTKVSIECPKHGYFEQRPSDHLKGSGCKLCNCRMQTRDEFIELASQKHHNQYDYSLTEYTTMKRHVTIICPNHGIFTQSPTTHLSNSGQCPGCKQENRLIVHKRQFIIDANRIHDNYYRYDQVDYVNVHTKVAIECPKHGVFLQKPNSHTVGGYGCIRCNKLGGYDYNRLNTDPLLGDTPGFIYLVQLVQHDDTFVKVGITKNLTSRMGSYTKFNGTLLASAPLTLFDAFKLEQNILNMHSSDQYHPIEKFNGYTECLNINSDKLQILIDMLGNIHFNKITLTE